MTGSTAPFMVIETEIRSSGMALNSTFMSSMESTATPGFAHIGKRARMIGVVAPMRG